MTPEELQTIRAVRYTRPYIGPLFFAVDEDRPGYYRSSARPPKGRGLYIIEGWGEGTALARLLSGPGSDAELWRHEAASIDEAESAAATHAQTALGKPKPKLQWKRGKDDEGEDAWVTEIDLPIWGPGRIVIPMDPEEAEFHAAWEGDSVWGQPGYSLYYRSKRQAEHFVRDWVAMAWKGVRYYRVFPFRLEDRFWPPGSRHQAAVAYVLELAAEVPKKPWSELGERQRAYVSSTRYMLAPEFRWEVKLRKGRHVLVPQPSREAAEHHGFFEVGQALGMYELVEYTTGPKPHARSLGIWKPPTIKRWRAAPAGPGREAKLVDVAWPKPEVAQMEMGAPAQVGVSAGYPEGVDTEGATEHLAQQMINEVVGDVQLAKATETQDQRALERAEESLQGARQRTESALEEIWTTFGGLQANRMRQDAEARRDAWLHENRAKAKLSAVWGPPWVDLDPGFDRIRIRGLAVGAAPTRNEAIEDAVAVARAHAAELELYADPAWIHWVDYEDDGLRFVLSVMVRESAQMELGVPAHWFREAQQYDEETN